MKRSLFFLQNLNIKLFLRILNMNIVKCKILYFTNTLYFTIFLFNIPRIDVIIRFYRQKLDLVAK